jgi:putative DNA methylase
MSGMGDALTAMRRAANEEYPVAIYYAFKQAEVAEEGSTSAGWASFLQAVVSATLMLDGTWPVRTESSGRLIGKDANALASSIVLVCRKRPGSARAITRADFLRELRRELPAAMKEIIAARVGPVDFEQAVIGPGMGVFSRYSKVLEEDDSPMSVKTALALINRVRLEVDAETGSFDPETQAALAWFQAHGYVEKTSGEAILLANAKGVALETLLASGVFRNGHGKVRLVRREDLPKGWSPKTDRNPTVWECVQHTARALEEGGSTPAAALIKAMDRKAEDALSLAYRLYDIANAKGEAAEARVYAELAAEWPDLETLAATLSEEDLAPRSGPAQAALFV